MKRRRFFYRIRGAPLLNGTKFFQKSLTSKREVGYEK